MAALGLYDTEAQHAIAAAGRRPVIGLDPGFGGAFSASIRAIEARQSAFLEEELRFDIVQERLDAFYLATGTQLENPATFAPQSIRTDIRTFFTPPRDLHADLWERTRTQYDTWAGTAGQPVFPTEADIAAEVLVRQRAQLAEAQRTLASSRTTGATVGARAGEMVGMLGDPIVASSLVFGAGWATGIIRTAMIEAGIGGASQFASDLAAMGRIQEVDPTFGMDDVLARAGFATAGGALFGGAIKSIAAVWSLARNARPWPSTVRDAGTAVEREAAAQPPQPVAPTVARTTTQRATVDQMVLDLAADRPLTVPPAAAAVADARIGRVFDASGRPVDVQYEVVPAQSLVLSHLPDGRVNPAYPAQFQPRDRTRAGSQAQVADIAANLQPERLGRSADAASGAPIVSADGVVDSGNGRVAAIVEAYRRGGESAGRYRAFLEGEGYNVAGIDDPVLIARRLTQLDEAERISFVDSANQSQILRLSASEQALADARLIDRGLLDELAEGEVASATNRGFVRGFIDRLPAGERGDLIDADGNLSQAGVRRVAAALMGRAYGDSAFLGRSLEHADSGIRTVAGSLQDAAGPWSQMTDAVARGTIPAGMDITRDLLDAVQTVIRARDAGVPVRKFFDQAEMFGGPSEVSKLLLRGMFNDEAMTRPTARSRVAAMLRGYATEAQKNDAGARLFGEPLRSEEVLQTALTQAGRSDLAAEAVARTTPEAAAKLADDPVTEDAIIRAGEELRLGAAPRMIPESVEDEAGNVVFTSKSLDEVFDEADAEIAAAREIETCANGTAAEAAQ